MTEEQRAEEKKGSILVVGGGISGLTATLEAAEVGYEVFLVEKNPYLGGRVAQLKHYFPKLCPPTCGLEINFRRIKDNPRITFYTLAEVENISGAPGNYDITIKLNPRYVNEKCTCCGECEKACMAKIPNEFNFGMGTTKGAYLPHEMAFPMRYVISPQIMGTEDAKRCVEACQYDAIDLEMQPQTVNLKVGAIIWATGWKPYDASKIDNLGFQYQNVITNMMMERLAASNGPTNGKILRPSDNKKISRIAFVQCAGSRDENHLPYCSYICCMASLKQATYVREQYPEAQIYVFYIDIRAPGFRYEKFYKKIKEDENIFLIKGKVAEVQEDPSTKDITVVAENAVTGEKIQETVDMAVLATGMVPNTADTKLPGGVKCDPDGFVVSDLAQGGMFATGCAVKPLDVISSNQHATGMALKAIQTLVSS
ncbi:MAG: CoB--CoM heterodisulfide reductase iron-sulfur subunit A family protein [Deltaproteobacteria bacterium]|mgnify:CR=1 FL=1|nr:CoB--CoM heterodisulfide reductase iron-sulfur subunit A family protein [Deltaproteobacteria bacterium]MBW2075299.1 CoB--CoM heterodisulfide reductase iron-sulfur subunit A family protein [Deltaproteobacteria bacterium]RLB81757.1 MAG: heterodisulfide reductase subunit A [Deltaproteobacteria bacterium]